ncbi:MAG: adenylate/guanylate cyclase domain-containing protein [Bacteroidia bacterium]|nr:adenylate/guanylate cyclase domain-containing protein [Bacteroidia bacterium]
MTHKIRTTLLLLLPLLVAVYVLLNQTARAAKPKAQQGNLDLRQWTHFSDAPLPLNGEWAFYANKFLTPADFDSTTPPPDGYIKVPGIWNAQPTANGPMPAHGFATYVLNIQLADTLTLPALNILTVSNAFNLWINDRPVARCGKTGTTASESEPGYKPQVVFFHENSRQLRIILQVSNFAHCKGGFWLPIELADAPVVQLEREKRLLLEMFLFGSLFIMALYHFSLYWLRRKDPSTLYFGIMCAVISIRSMFTGENLIHLAFPELNWYVARKIEYILTFCSAPVYVTFVWMLYREEWNKWVYRIITGFGVLLILFVLFTPSVIYTNTSYVFIGYAWLTSLYTIYVFIKAARRKKEGAIVFLATSILFLLTIVNDTLNQLELIYTGLYLTFGLLLVTMAQAYVLSSRYAGAFRKTELYADTFRKFVPVQFLDRIAKEGIESIKPGNAEKVQASVLFSDIRSFTSLAEKMTPEEVFVMLNQYLSFVEPPIRAGNGFVDKYMGDGIMALFESNALHSDATNAVTAALEMQQTLALLNTQRTKAGTPELKMGIGIHSGFVIMGTLGGNERMDSTAIGDAVNLASRIESMTKMYGVELLATSQTMERLERKDELLFRFVDRVVAKGKKEAHEIWEIIGWKNRLAPLETAFVSAYEKAMEAYLDLRIKDAYAEFEKCEALKPGDKVVEMYLQRCRGILESGRTGEVGGSTILSEK